MIKAINHQIADGRHRSSRQIIKDDAKAAVSELEAGPLNMGKDYEDTGNAVERLQPDK